MQFGEYELTAEGWRKVVSGRKKMRARIMLMRSVYDPADAMDFRARA